MKTELIIVLFISMLLLGCPINPPPPNNQTVCPSDCKFGCMSDNKTCNLGPSDPCANVNCTDKCEDNSVLNTNGQCQPDKGICVYKKMLCIFGCENNNCRAAPVCPANCPFGCEPGTDVCRSAICPIDCAFGCIPGTTQCNIEPPSSGIKNGDFEDGYLGWVASGIAFGSAPTDAEYINSNRLYSNVPYSGYSGSHFASSYFPEMDKRAMGTLTSEQFFINKNYFEFLVVGQLSKQAYIDLIVNNSVVYHLEPDNPYPPFNKITWNVSQYKGKNGIIKVVDISNRNSIEVDGFRFVDTPSLNPGQPYVDPYRNFSIVPPLNWILKQGASRGQLFIYGTKENNFTTQMMVLTETVNENETTSSYTAKGKTGLAMLLQNYSLKSENDTVINGLSVKQMEYTYTFLNINLRTREVFFVYNGVGYTISAMASEKSFERHSEEFSNSMNSFKPPVIPPCKSNEINCYADSKYGFAVISPDGWQASQGTMGTTAVFIGPMDGNFTPNCNVAEEELPSNYTLTEYVKEGKTALAGSLSNYTLTSERNRTIDGEEAYELVSTYTLLGNYKMQQAILIKNGVAHLITCTMTQGLFDRHQSEFESIITSFRLE